MRRLKAGLIVLVIGFFLAGCAATKEEARIKCPKCGALFRVETSSPGVHPRF